LHTLDQTVLGLLLLIGVGLWLKNTELHHAKEAASLMQMGTTTQLSAVGQSMMLCLFHLFAPDMLSILYTDSSMWLIGLGIWAAGLVGVYLLMPRLGRGIFAALAAFVLLAGASVNWFDATRLSHVTDASAYLSMLPILILAVSVIANVIARFKPQGPNLIVGLSAIALIAAGLPAWLRTHVFESPVTMWRDTVARHPESVLAESSLAQALRGQARLDAAVENKDAVEDDYNQAIQHAQAVLALDARNALAQEIWAEILIDRGQDAQALPHFEAAIASDATNARVITEYGSALVTLGRFQPAIKALNQSLAQDASQGVTHRLLGKAYFGLNDFERTVKEEQIAMELDQTDLAAREILADAQAKLGKFQEAIANYGQVIADPAQMHRPDLWMKVARIKDQQGVYQNAIDYMSAALKLAPDDAAISAELEAEKVKEQKAAATRPSTRSASGPTTSSTEPSR
jgi:tetratricopeptide (TPR) repeat protein